jgi:hypothetical protein
MITVSDAWKDIQQRFLLPETYIEIDCGVTDDEAQSLATATGTLLSKDFPFTLYN